jgi:hypothetical protein
VLCSAQRPTCPKNNLGGPLLLPMGALLS